MSWDLAARAGLWEGAGKLESLETRAEWSKGEGAGKGGEGKGLAPRAGHCGQVVVGTKKTGRK